MECNKCSHKVEDYYLCYFCGEISCVNCIERICINCNQKPHKRKTEAYENKKIIEIIDKYPNHKNISALCSIVAKYYTVLEDKENAIFYSFKAAKLGSSDDQFFIGLLYYFGLEEFGYKKDYQKSLHWFTIAAENKHYTSLAYMCKMYKEGLGVDKDIKRAKTYAVLSKFYKKTAT